MSGKRQNECVVPGCCLRHEGCPLQAAGSPQGLWQTHSAWGDIILLLSCCLKTFEKTFSSLTRPSDVLVDPHHHHNWPFAGFGSPPSDCGRNQLQNEASPQEPSRSRMQNWWGYIFLLNSESEVKYSLWWFEIESTLWQLCVSYAGERKPDSFEKNNFSLSLGCTGARLRGCHLPTPSPHLQTGVKKISKPLFLSPANSFLKNIDLNTDFHHTYKQRDGCLQVPEPATIVCES